MQTCVHVLATLSQGGNESLAKAIIKGWPVDQHHVIAVLGIHDGPLRQEFEALGKVMTIPPGWPLSLRRIWKTWNFISKQQPISLVSYTFNMQALLVCWIARIRRVPSVVMRVGNTPPKDKKQRSRWIWLIRLCRLSGVQLISCSDSVHRQISELSRLPIGSKPILNGCDSREIKRRSEKSRSERPENDPKTILMVARLDPIKDQETLIRAFGLVRPANWRLRLVGEGTERKRLIKLAEKLGLDPFDIFLGPRSDIPELLGQADIFAFSTTEDEGFGIALIEAMAAGLPLIASDVTACREVLRNGLAGDLITVHDVQAWAKELKLLTESEQFRRELKERAQKYIYRYDISRATEEWYRLTEMNINNKRASHS